MSAAPKLQAGEVFLNPAARTAAVTAPPRAPLGLHRRLPGYAATPLADAPALATANGVERVWVKDESSRLGLPAFKMLGASWAAYRALAARLGRDPEPWVSLDELRQTLAPLRPLTLATATDGNHGRAVARMAALLGLDADVYVPKGTATVRIAAIEAEGARVTVVDGDYDRAVASAAAAGDRCLAIQDVGWPGYEQVPAWVVEGYATIFWEVDAQLAARGEEAPDVVVIPVGVGGLAAAAVRHWHRRGLRRPPRLLGVEPLAAACVLRSLQVGRIVTIPGPHDSIMAGAAIGPGRRGGGRRRARAPGHARPRRGRHRRRRDRRGVPRRPRRGDGGPGGRQAARCPRPRGRDPRPAGVHRGRHRPGGLPSDRGRYLT